MTKTSFARKDQSFSRYFWLPWPAGAELGKMSFTILSIINATFKPNLYCCHKIPLNPKQPRRYPTIICSTLLSKTVNNLEIPLFRYCLRPSGNILTRDLSSEGRINKRSQFRGTKSINNMDFQNQPW